MPFVSFADNKRTMGVPSRAQSSASAPVANIKSLRKEAKKATKNIIDGLAKVYNKNIAEYGFNDDDNEDLFDLAVNNRFEEYSDKFLQLLINYYGKR